MRNYVLLIVGVLGALWLASYVAQAVQSFGDAASGIGG